MKLPTNVYSDFYLSLSKGLKVDLVTFQFIILALVRYVE